MPKMKRTPVKFCAYCGEKLERKTYSDRLEDLGVFRRRKYCDQKCMASGQIKKDATKSAYLKRIHHLRGSSCEICGSTSNLANHHKDENWKNEEPSNLMTLCGSCHTKLHWQTGKKIPKKQLPCKVCGKPSKGLGMCEKHYVRFKKYGDPYLTKRKIGSVFVLVRE